MLKRLFNWIFNHEPKGYSPPPVDKLDMSKVFVTPNAQKHMTQQTIQQLNAFIKLDEAIIEAIKVGKIETVIALTEIRNGLPCPICRRNQPKKPVPPENIRMKEGEQPK